MLRPLTVANGDLNASLTVEGCISSRFPVIDYGQAVH